MGIEDNRQQTTNSRFMPEQRGKSGDNPRCDIRAVCYGLILHSPVSSEIAITIGAVASSPLMSSRLLIVSLRCGVTVK